MPTLPANLTKGAIYDGWKILEVVDAANAKYVMVKAEDQTIATAIAGWTPARLYNKDNICIRNKAFFASLIDGNIGKDPLTDASGAWGVFNPGSASDIFLNRSPTNSDVYPVGTKFWDVSFGADTPLGFVSLGNGVWAYINEIKLTKIRLYCNGNVSTYRSSISNVKFFKPDGIQIPNSHFVWGVSSGIGGGAAGVAYAGQQIYCGYNSSGYVEIELSSLFDTKITIGKLTGDYPSDSRFVQCSRVEFYYTNGSRKVYSATGYQANAGITLVNCDPAVVCRYGDSIAAAQGPMLTAAKLTDPNSNEYGRISGAAFTSAFNQLMAPFLARLTALEPLPPPKVLSVVIQQGIPVAGQATATLSPPEGKAFKFGGLFWMLNRIAPTMAEIGQGSGGTDSVNYNMPTEPGTYQLILQPSYEDGSTGDLRENFTVT